MLNAKALLFVDDDETEIAKLDVAAEQAVGADDHVDCAGF